jgi:hypothetical protein
MYPLIKFFSTFIILWRILFAAFLFCSFCSANLAKMPIVVKNLCRTRDGSATQVINTSIRDRAIQTDHSTSPITATLITYERIQARMRKTD